MGGADVFLDQLYGQSKLSPALDRADPSKWYLYTLLRIPVHIIIQDLYELVNGDILPGMTIEHLVLQPAEEAFACRIIRRAAFLWHWADQPGIFHTADSARPTIMASPLRMDYRILARFQCLDCRIQHLIVLTYHQIASGHCRSPGFCPHPMGQF